MAGFLCHAAQATVWSEIALSCDRQAIELHRSSPTRATFVHRRSLYQPSIDIQTRSSPNSTHLTLLEINLGFHRVRWVLYAVALVLGLCALGLSLRFITPFNVTGLLAFFALFSIGMACLASYLVSSYSQDKQNHTYTLSLINNLKQSMKVEQISPAERHESRLILLLLAALVVSLVLLVAWSIGSPIGNMFLLWLCPSLFLLLLVWGCHSNRWLKVPFSLYMDLIHTCFLPILVHCLILAITSGFHYYAHEKDNSNREVKSFGQFARQLSVTWRLLEDTEKSPEIFARDIYPADLFRKYPFSPTALCSVAVFVAAVILIFGVASNSKHDLDRLVFQQPSSRMPLVITPFPGPRVRQGKNTIVLALAAISGGIVFWTCFFWSVDAGIYIFQGRSFFIKPLGYNLAFFSMLAEKGIEDRFFLPELFLAICYTAMLSPAVLILALTIRRTSSFFAREARFMRASDEIAPDWLDHDRFLKQVSECNCMPAITLEVKEKSVPAVYSQASILSKRCRIFIAATCKDYLTETEINALLAHEIYHLNDGRTRQRIFQISSMLLLCPPIFRHFLSDFTEKEHEADDFAVRTMGSSRPLIAALSKLSVLEFGRKDDCSQGICVGKSPEEKGITWCFPIEVLSA